MADSSMITPDYILQFMAAGFPDAPDLALAPFNEKHAIVTATQTIVELREELLQCRAKLALAAESAAGDEELRDELLASLEEIVAEWGFPNTPKWHRARAAIDKVRSNHV